MIAGEDLPAVNAVLNTASALLATTGYLFIRRRRVRAHVACMVSAVCMSALFLASYLYYHFVIKSGAPTRYAGPEWAYYPYYAILLSHTLLAMIVVPLVVLAVVLALRRSYRWHVRLARWALPIWLYVSVTGVVVYLMLYQL
jgi:uncharacterized membrane protein YozB (DUF420 family)